mmetsp:Transcript_24742/g.63798  ORF Transcript_24742/g.63798 Transcript_24742/m.63798 type:complete len:215 (-) Transcript_24742:1658-2302(-)
MSLQGVAHTLVHAHVFGGVQRSRTRGGGSAVRRGRGDHGLGTAFEESLYHGCCQRSGGGDEQVGPIRHGSKHIFWAQCLGRGRGVQQQRGHQATHGCGQLLLADARHQRVPNQAGPAASDVAEAGVLCVGVCAGGPSQLLEQGIRLGAGIHHSHDLVPPLCDKPAARTRMQPQVHNPYFLSQILQRPMNQWLRLEPWVCFPQHLLFLLLLFLCL